MVVVSRSRTMTDGGGSIVAWVVDGDGDIVDEIDVDLNGVLLPDDYLLRLINVLSGLVNDDSS